MRKILMILIIVLLGLLCYFALTSGVSIGNFKILSIEQIDTQSKNLNAKIEEINTLIDIQYPAKISQLKAANNNMQTAKSEYLRCTNLSTDEQILDAMQKKSYTIEFLWASLGSHARNEGINLTFEIVSSATGANDVNDIKFTANGSYIAITNFIYAIENDPQLNFRIENFKLLPYENEILQGTFTVRNIAIEGNTLPQDATATNLNEGQQSQDVVDNTTNNELAETNTITE